MKQLIILTAAFVSYYRIFREHETNLYANPILPSGPTLMKAKLISWAREELYLRNTEPF
ncbi:MAG: hypothetical protein IPM38_01795 [Ignavibacteria bacterium]|nr:hypothetical protein [Ignavibacteria bacterium]